MGQDNLIKEDFAQFSEKVIDGIKSRHPHMFALINTILSGKENQIGLQLVENGKGAGEYTFNLKGVRIASIDSGNLRSEINASVMHSIKPYVVVELRLLETMIKDPGFCSDVSLTIPKYLPGLTVKFV